MKIWEVKGTYNVDGIIESETWLYKDKAQAFTQFHAKVEEDFAEIKGRREENEIHVNPEHYVGIDDGDYIIEYGKDYYCSYEQGYGGSTTVEFSLKEKEVR